MQVIVIGLLMILALTSSLRSSLSSSSLFRGVRLMATEGASIPKGVIVDLVQKTGDGPVCDMNEKVDIGSILSSHKKCVLFAVPGTTMMITFSMIII